MHFLLCKSAALTLDTHRLRFFLIAECGSSPERVGRSSRETRLREEARLLLGALLLRFSSVGCRIKYSRTGSKIL